MRGLGTRKWGRWLSVSVIAVVPVLVVGVAWALEDPLDPAHSTPLPCEVVSTPGAVPRSARNIVHVANVCDVVGTDVEFQSRTDASGAVHDFAFLGTMGGGLRIYDVTTPSAPSFAGGYTDPGWQNDVQVRGNLAVVGFDPIGGANPSTSACLQGKGASGGVDLVRLVFDPVTALFTTGLIDCVSASPSGGAHNSTLHPSGSWLAMINPRTHGSVDVVDLRTSPPRRVYRIVQSASLASTACAGAAAGQCVPNGRPGTWSPHDVSFSRDGRTMYVAAVGNDTVIVDVTNVLSGSVSTVGVASNDSPPTGDVATNPHDVSISHQSDVSSDGSILIVTDERGGGTSQTSCNTDPNGIIGGMHFWALKPLSGVPGSAGASPASPKRIGGWFYPNPGLLVDALAPALTVIGRLERACTIHVFRAGGNGSSAPGPAQAGFDGVSSLPNRQLVSAHYGAGVWHIDFSSAASALDGIGESTRTTWANTLGWNVMPGAETWSAKEYKGHIYAGDMTRGFDVYRFTTCQGLGCVTPPPPNSPGQATGGGQVSTEQAEMSISRGIGAGGRANFAFDAEYSGGVVSGDLTYVDHGQKKNVESTSVTSFTRTGSKASFGGVARVDGRSGVSFTVEVEDFGEPGSADTFKIVLGDGYTAGGVLLKGNIQVRDA